MKGDLSDLHGQLVEMKSEKEKQDTQLRNRFGTNHMYICGESWLATKDL